VPHPGGHVQVQVGAGLAAVRPNLALQEGVEHRNVQRGQSRKCGLLSYSAISFPCNPMYVAFKGPRVARDLLSTKNEKSEPINIGFR
jgi:hypothetical protein